VERQRIHARIYCAGNEGDALAQILEEELKHVFQKGNVDIDVIPMNLQEDRAVVVFPRLSGQEFITAKTLAENTTRFWVKTEEEVREIVLGLQSPPK